MRTLLYVSLSFFVLSTAVAKTPGVFKAPPKPKTLAYEVPESSLPPSDYERYQGSVALVVDNRSDHGVRMRADGQPFEGMRLEDDLFTAKRGLATFSFYTSDGFKNFTLLRKQLGPTYTSMGGIQYRYAYYFQSLKGLPLNVKAIDFSVKGQAKSRFHCVSDKPLPDDFTLVSIVRLRYDGRQCLMSLFGPGKEEFERFMK